MWSNYANYTKDFRHNSSFSATLGQEAQRGYGNGISITAFDVPADASLQYASASRSTGNVVRSSQYDGGLLSYFGRANYNFRDRYLVTGTLRFDQTSKFLGPVRTGYISVGGRRLEHLQRELPEECQLHIGAEAAGQLRPGGQPERGPQLRLRLGSTQQPDLLLQRTWPRRAWPSARLTIRT